MPTRSPTFTIPGSIFTTPHAFYNAARVHEFEKLLDKDKGEQARQARAILRVLAEQAGPDATFGSLAQVNRQKVLDLVERECQTSALAAHETARAAVSDVDPLLGVGITTAAPGRLKR